MRIRMHLATVATFLCVFLAGSAAGEIVLIPIGGTQQPIPGALGSQWVVEEFARNTGATSVDYFKRGCPTELCAYTWLPGESLRGFYYPYAVFLFSGNDADQIRFSIIARDISRQNETWGAEIPVVRERDLRTDRLELIRVPTDSAYRRNLRLYAVSDDGRGGLTVWRVRVYDASADLRQETILLGEREFVLNAQEGSAIGYVGFATIANLDELFALTTSDAVRVVVERLSGTARIWAFVTLTNNATQHFTIVTP
jgi:hypothetical protein